MRTILIVEDYRSTRDALVYLLSEHGFRTVAAPNGDEALAYLSQGGSADLILLDLMMPAMDGWTFRRAQQRDPWLADIPVIVLSALSGRPITGLAAAAVFEKPINGDALVSTVRALCTPPSTSG